MFAGLDVHKETSDVSIAEGARHGEVRHCVIASDLESLDKVDLLFAASRDEVSAFCERPQRPVG
jgi:hypothetical protein